MTYCASVLCVASSKILAVCPTLQMPDAIPNPRRERCKCLPRNHERQLFPYALQSYLLSEEEDPLYLLTMQILLRKGCLDDQTSGVLGSNASPTGTVLGLGAVFTFTEVIAALLAKRHVAPWLAPLLSRKSGQRSAIFVKTQ